jgi:hypothetical protein
VIFPFRPRARMAGWPVFVRHRRQAADLPPYAKSAATRFYRDIGFSSDTRRKVTPALVAGPGAIAGAGKKPWISERRVRGSPNVVFRRPGEVSGAGET